MKTKYLIITIVVMISLFFITTNPSFTSHKNKLITDNYDKKPLTGENAELLKVLALGIGDIACEMFLEYHNYLFFSTTNIVNTNDLMTIGIATKIIIINKTEKETAK